MKKLTIEDQIAGEKEWNEKQKQLYENRIKNKKLDDINYEHGEEITTEELIARETAHEEWIEKQDRIHHNRMETIPED